MTYTLASHFGRLGASFGGRRFARDRRGLAATEAALMISLLLLPMVGIAIEGWRFKDSHEAIQESLTTLSIKASHAPSNLAARRTEYETAVRTIVGSSARLTAREFCVCSADQNTRGLAAPERACNAVCPSWNGVAASPGKWIEFRVTSPYTPMVSFGPITSRTLDSKTRVRSS